MKFTGSQLIAHQDKLLGYAYKQVKDRDVAQDLVQTTYMRAIRYEHTWDPKKGVSFGAWLMGILKNVVRAHLKKEYFQSPLIDSTPLEEIQHYNAPKVYDTYDEGAVFENEKLDKEYKKLPPRSKEIIKLTYVDEKDNADIAALLGVSVSNCNDRRRVAKRLLRQRMRRLEPSEYYRKRRLSK